MITIQQRLALKKLLKGDYINDVKAKLAERNVVSKNNTPYSDKMISHVFNGRYENRDIEFAIFDVYLDRKEKRDKDERWKDDILGNSPSENDDD